MFLVSALLMGMVGNFHCLGMCGPIALSVPIKQQNSMSRFFSVICYNFGRIVVYTVFGLLFGLFGEGLKLVGMQQYISLVLGIILIALVFFPLLSKKMKNVQTPIMLKVAGLKSSFYSNFKKGSYNSLFTLGILNGLLPCGLVYIALAGAISSNTWYEGALFMTLFGIGTVPVMMVLPFFKELIKNKIGLKWKRVIPVFTLLFGLLLIIRGANMGIPYLSPKIDTSIEINQFKCH